MPSPRAISSLVQSRNVDIRVANSTRFKQTTYLIVLSFSVVRLCFFSLCFRFFLILTWIGGTSPILVRVAREGEGGLRCWCGGWVIFLGVSVHVMSREGHHSAAGSCD